MDLPGTYSLTAFSDEELISRNYIINKKPDIIVDIVDASEIERNLYLYIQLMEMDVPLMLVFNMSDIAEQRGLVFDIEQFPHCSKRKSYKWSAIKVRENKDARCGG